VRANNGSPKARWKDKYLLWCCECSYRKGGWTMFEEYGCDVCICRAIDVECGRSKRAKITEIDLTGED